MAIEIANGAVAECTAFWSFGVLAGSSSLVSTVIAQVGQELTFDGLNLNSYDAGALNFFFDGNTSVHFYILNQSGQELDDSDLAAQVADAVAAAGGTQNSFLVNSVTGPDAGTNTGTGQSRPTTTTTPSDTAQKNTTPTPASTAHQCGDPSWAWYTDIPQAISCATGKALSTLGLLMIGLIIGVVLIVAAEEKTKMGV
jgi:hypothetical protein